MKNVVAVFLLVCFDRVVIALFCLFAGLAFSTFSHAGYYATITSNSSAYCGVPVSSGCFLTLSMAIGQSCPGIVKQIETIDSSAKTWSSTYSGHTSHDASGTYSECAGGASIPALAVGVVDPSISSSGGTGGSGGSSSPDVSALQSTVTALQGQLAAVSAANVQNSSDLSRVNTALSEPYDYGTGGLIFSAMLISTLSLYLLARGLMMFVAAVNAARRL